MGVVGIEGRRVIPTLGFYRRAIAVAAGNTGGRLSGGSDASGTLRGGGAPGRAQDVGAGTTAGILEGLAR